LIGGVVLLLGGHLLLGALLLVLSLLLGAVAGAVATARKIKSTVSEWAGLLRGGRPNAVRIVSIEPPRSVVFSPQLSVTVEIEGVDGNAKILTRDIPIPRLQALAWKLARRSPLPLPDRLDFERQLRLRLRSAG
jgi:hypothetical protein